MKTIKLSPEKYNKEVIVDDEDYDFLIKFNWNYGGSYARRKRNGKMIYMHRIIMNAPKEFEVDHINGNMLDNRKENLRICTRSQNHMNRDYPIGKSGARGVTICKKTGKFIASIRHDGVKVNIGTFNTVNEASIAYSNCALKYRGEFATAAR